MADQSIIYFVNGEEQTTTDHKLTPAQILERAGFVPHVEYKLVRDDGHKELTDHNKEEPIHPGERFTATSVAPTPTS
ncbi:hypothetical protein [Candidatus Amarobacter glycogenicus]|uniref:hypothetical protein n=1 Tax=Candidatus Amarobacter glycogenicus TaxID=3140699 RepID=UPI002A141A49|nr:hypothetical protein [Dehalococcoidia bacterium]